MDALTLLGWERLWTYSRLLMLTSTFDGGIVQANPAWQDVLGWPVDQILGTSFFDLVHPDDRDRTVAEAAAMMHEGRQVPKFQNRYRAVDGSYRHIDWTAVSDGKLIHALGRDQTAELGHASTLASAEEALRQSQKLEAVGQLTGGVAHDFNNLLTVIKGSVELLRRPGLSDEKRQRYIDAIGDTADRAAKLTGQLLAFARRQALQPEVFDLAASIGNVAGIVRSLAGSRIGLETPAPQEQLFVLADRSQFDTAIVNMAVNARDAMNGEGRLTIASGAVPGIPAIRAHPAIPGDYVAVTVSDSGTGIAPDRLGQVFEPFFTTKGVGQGTGLGLSQVLGFAKQSGGDVTVESRLGHGSTFTLYLPRAYPGTDEAVQETAEPTIDGEGVCVLLVEDNSSVGEFAKQALKELGYESILAPNAQAALAELRRDSSRFHVIFSDVVMPGMTGVELAERVRHDHPDIPIVLTSGYSHVLAQNGAHGFELLHKPYSIEQLSRILRKAIAWQMARRSQAE
jgi:PAS domain S-box-containing protein